MISIAFHKFVGALLRLGHNYGIGESASLSVPVTVDVAAIFAPRLTVNSLTELSLTAMPRRGTIAWKTADAAAVDPTKYVPLDCVYR